MTVTGGGASLLEVEVRGLVHRVGGLLDEERVVLRGAVQVQTVGLLALGLDARAGREVRELLGVDRLVHAVGAPVPQDRGRQGLGVLVAVVDVVVDAGDHLIGVDRAGAVLVGSTQDLDHGGVAPRVPGHGGGLLGGEDVVHHLGVGGVPAQSVLGAPLLHLGAHALGVAGVAAVGTGVLLDPQAGERVGDGVVPHAGVVGPGDVDTDAGPGHDVGGDEVVGGDLVEDRHRDVDEVVANDLGVDHALVEPDSRGPVLVIGRGVGDVRAGGRVVHGVVGEADVLGVGDLGVGQGAVGAAVLRDEAGGVVVPPHVVLHLGTAGVVDAEGVGAVVLEQVVRHDRVGRVDDLQRTGRRGVAEGGVLNARSTVSGHDHSATGDGADLGVLVVPALHRGVLLHRQPRQGDVVGVEGHGAGVLDHLDLVLVGVDTDDVGGAPVRLDVVAGLVVFGVLQGDRVGVLHVEGGLGDLGAAEHLGQGLAVHEHLLGVGGDPLLGGVGIDGADRAEADHVLARGPLPVTAGTPALGDLGTGEDRLGTLGRLDGHALVDGELALTVGAVGQLDGVSAGGLLQGGSNGLKGLGSGSVSRVRASLGRDMNGVAVGGGGLWCMSHGQNRRRQR